MNYRTRSVACFPLLKTTHELVGVIQIVNSKHGADFSQEELDIARALSGPIAVALETAVLYQDIEDLFDGFIKASVTAIESRDPTTSGHSERVARLTVGLAEEVSTSEQKAFRNISFNDLQIKEIRYASLLHDFGKIGVPEHVLLKEKKLYPMEYMEIFRRYSVLKLAHPDRAAELEEIWHTIVSLNEPSIKFVETKDSLAKYIGSTMRVFDEDVPLLTETEYESLSIGKGSLTDEDRLLIESHVTHTYNFLKQIPWTRYLKRIPEISYAHHEKLDGTGYPRSLEKKDIPIESQIMAVADIFDALTAQDRPYKKAMPTAKAIEILFEDAKKGKITRDLVEIFAEKKVYLLTQKS
jgi:HD-GYP domain-containing protein (c-di-GMP phosphodiesterase class II)